MKRQHFLDGRGFSLVELMVVSALVSFGMIFLFSIIRNVGSGMMRVQQRAPLQRDLQWAKQTIERDLLSASRGSLGNVIPNPGYEAVPTRISTFTPTSEGYWACVDVLPRIQPRDYSIGYISNHPNFRKQGEYGLSLNSEGTYTAASSTFSLVGGNAYLFGGWVRQYPGNLTGGAALGDGGYKLFGDATPWPTTSQSDLSVNGNLSLQWTFLKSTFTAIPGFRYRVTAFVNNEPRNFDTHFGYDDVTVVPLQTDMTPTNGTVFEFDKYQTRGALMGQRLKMRYRLEPWGTSGRLVREEVPFGGPVRTLSAITNIRSCQMAWDFGEATPGVLPGPPSAGNTFDRGFSFPLIVTLEAGPIGATGNQTLSIQFSVYPEAP